MRHQFKAHSVQFQQHRLPGIGKFLRISLQQCAPELRLDQDTSSTTLHRTFFLPMAQLGWVFLDNQGGRHRVGLYHGDESGHLVLYCNLRVVQLDFSVKDSKTYSFFIEDEFCEVRLVKEPAGHFTYEFVVNKKVDTPLNRERKAEDRRTRKYIALLALGLLLLIASVVGGLRWYARYQREKHLADTGIAHFMSPANQNRLNAEGKPAVAQLFILDNTAPRKVFFRFKTADSVLVSGKLSVPDSGQIILPNGFPLSDRDAFQATYLPADPRVNRVDFYQPTPQTLETYLRLATKAEREAHPDASAAHSLCLARLALTQKGWKSLADVIFQTQTPQQNPQHNQDAYLRLVREQDFGRLLRENCWDQ